MPWGTKSPDFMRWFITWPCCPPTPSSAAPVSCVIAHFYLSGIIIFSYFMIHVLRFRLMIFMREIKYCLCAQSPADSSSFCTKLAQDQLASKNASQPSLPKETGFYEAWHMPSKLFHRFQCHNDLLSQKMVKETNVKSFIVFDMTIKGHCYLLNT